MRTRLSGSGEDPGTVGIRVHSTQRQDERRRGGAKSARHIIPRLMYLRPETEETESWITV